MGGGRTFGRRPTSPLCAQRRTRAITSLPRSFPLAGRCAQRRGPISVGPLLCAHPIRTRKWGEGRGGTGEGAPPIVLCSREWDQEGGGVSTPRTRRPVPTPRNGGGGQRGGAGFCAPCLVRVIGGAKGRGGAYLSRFALLPRLRAEVGWRQPHAQREGEAATCRAGRHRGGARTGGGACGMRGRVCMCPPIPLHAPVRMRRGRAPRAGGREWEVVVVLPSSHAHPPNSKRGRRLLTCYFPLFVFIFTFKIQQISLIKAEGGHGVTTNATGECGVQVLQQ